MSDDVCGHPTDDGSPCELPASRDDGRCHHHTTIGLTDSGGRPSVFTEEHARDAIKAAREGFSKAGCARAAGIPESTLRAWLDGDYTIDGEDFSRIFARARHDGERQLVKGPLTDREDKPDIDGQHARFLLSTSFDYVETERHELENTGDEPLSELVIDFDNVDT